MLTHCLRTVRLHGGELFRMCWPILLSQAALLCNGMADAMMAGHYGTLELAAAGVAWSIWVTLFAGLVGVLQGAAPLLARHSGAGQTEAIAGYVRSAVVLALLLSVAGICVLKAAVTFFHLWPDIPAGVAALASRYLATIALALPAVLLVRVFQIFTTSLKLPRPVMVINAASLLVKLPVSYALMYGSFGLPRLGLTGCAWGTVAMFWTMLVLCAAYLILDRHYHQFLWPVGEISPGRYSMTRILALGLPIGVSQVLEIGSLAVTTLIVAKFGQFASAAHQVFTNLTGFMFMVPMSIGTGVQTLIAHARGAQNGHRSRDISVAGLTISAFIGTTACAILYLFRMATMGFYTLDSQVTGIAVAAFPFFLCYQFFDGMQCVASSALRGYEETLIPTAIYLVSLWGGGVLGGWLLAAHGVAMPGFDPFSPSSAVADIWIAGAASLALCFGGFLVRLWWCFDQHDETPTASDASLLPSS